jgi:hypothetical protein
MLNDEACNFLRPACIQEYGFKQAGIMNIESKFGVIDVATKHRTINSILILFILIILVTGFCMKLHKSNKRKHDEEIILT